MKTINWQTKALTLFIAVVALGLIAACGSADTVNESPQTQETIKTSTQAVTEAPTAETTETPTEKATEVSTKEPSAAPTREAMETPTKESTQVLIDEIPEPESGCTHETPELTSTRSTTRKEHYEFLARRSDAEHVKIRYRELLWRQPNVYEVNSGFLRDERGGWTDEWGVIVWVTDRLDQNTLPLEYRIPDSLNDVPIQIVEMEPPAGTSESGCNIFLCGVKLIEGEESKITMNTPNRRSKVRAKYDPLFWRQPNAFAVSISRLVENRKRTDTRGIVVRVTKRVDQSRLPPEDRLPDCLEGVPIQFLVGSQGP